MINQKEKLQILAAFMWRLNFHRTVTMRQDKVLEMLKMSDVWVGAHSDCNGERSEKDIKANVQAAYEKLKTLP